VKRYYVADWCGLVSWGLYAEAAAVWAGLDNLQRCAALDRWKLLGGHAWYPPKSDYWA
jgi:hypothetical protein